MHSFGKAKNLLDEQLLEELSSFQLIGKPKDVEPLLHDKAVNCVIEQVLHNPRQLYRCSIPSVASNW